MSNPNEQYIEKLQAMKLVSGLPEYQDALTAAIEALEAQQQTKVAPPNLNAVRRLIEVAQDCEPVPVAGTAMMGTPQGKLVGCVDAARDALPALEALLAERERLREDRRKLRRFVKEFRAWVGSEEEPETVFDVPVRDMEQRAEQLLEETKDG